MHKCEWDEHKNEGWVYCWICGGEKEIIKTNSYGRIWIETDDFFNQKNIKNQINNLLKSDLVTKINKDNEV